MKTSLEPLHPFSFSSSQPVIVSTSWFQCLPPEYSQLLILSTSQSFISSSSHLLFPPVQHLALSHPLMSSTSQPPCSSSRYRLTFSYSHFPPSFQLLILSDSWFRNCPTSRLLTLFTFSVRRSFRRLSGQKFVPLSGRPFQIAFNSPHKVRKFASYLAALALS